MTDTESFDATHKRYLQQLQACRIANLKSLTDALSAHGIATVTLSFDGCGDQGQIESTTLSDANGNSVAAPDTTLSIRVTEGPDSEPSSHTKALREAIEDFAYDALGELYLGWQDNDGSFGTITIDVAENRASLEINERFTDHHTTTVEL